MIKTVVNASIKYDILIERGLIRTCGKYIKEVIPSGKALIITDSNAKIYLEPVKRSLEENGFSCIEYVFNAGESSKSIEEFEKILEFAAANGLTRSDFIVALGGGVCGDLSGFAAASYMRGIKFVQIPTTLLAAVDSSVGGKTAVNLKGGKNLAGAFHQPSLVITDPDTFKSLDKEYYLDGVSESIKYGILSDKELFDKFKGNTEENIESIIADCTRIKSKLVSEDEFDTGARQLLNLGHTFGHSIEKLSSLTISHGHAVAIGMVIAARAAEKMGLCEKGTLDEIISILKINSLPTECPFTAEEIYSGALTDKKRTGGYISVVLPEKIGKCILKKVSIEEFRTITEKGVSA